MTGTFQGVVVLGPTATGKTRLGVGLAREFHGEIVSADSRQVYRGLDLGTGKDLTEYGTGTAAVRHHLIDVAEPTEEFHLYRFVQLARPAIAEIVARGALPLAVGGTPLYLNALLDDYALEGGAPDPARRRQWDALSDAELLAQLQAAAPDLYARTDKTQRRRILRALEIACTRGGGADVGAACRPAAVGDERRRPPLILGPYYPRQEVHRRIAERLDARLEAGLVGEVARLHDGGVSWERLDYLGLEYRYVARHLQGQLSAAEMRTVLLAKIRHFCKAQDIWFRKMEREGKVIHWIPGGDPALASRLVRTFLAGWPLPPPVLRLCETYYGPRSVR